MTISRLNKFKENFKLYSILATITLAVIIISLGACAYIFNDERQIVFIRAILVILVFFIASLEAMYEAIIIKLYSYNDGKYVLYAGVLNTYLFIDDKLILSKYDINTFNKHQLKYLNGDELIEISISGIRNRVVFKIEGSILEKDR